MGREHMLAILNSWGLKPAQPLSLRFFLTHPARVRPQHSRIQPLRRMTGEVFSLAPTGGEGRGEGVFRQTSISPPTALPRIFKSLFLISLSLLFVLLPLPGFAQQDSHPSTMPQQPVFAARAQKAYETPRPDTKRIPPMPKPPGNSAAPATIGPNSPGTGPSANPLPNKASPPAAASSSATPNPRPAIIIWR